jgi:uncharacterized protein with HEPN domain
VKKDPRVYLRHILDGIAKVEEYTEGMSKDEFVSSVQTQDAVIRRLEIIGEAAKNVPSEFRRKHSEVPWAEMSRMRDKLIHKYFDIDLSLAWDAVRQDLPDLKKRIKELLEESGTE